MQAGAIITVALPPRYERTRVTVILVGKARLLVELPNGAQTWVKQLDLNRRDKTGRAA